MLSQRALCAADTSASSAPRHGRASRACARCFTPGNHPRCAAHTAPPMPVLRQGHDFPALRPRTRTATPSQMTYITSPIHHAVQAGPPICQSATNGHATAMPASGRKPPPVSAPGHPSPEIHRQHVTKRPLSARVASSLLLPVPESLIACLATPEELSPRGSEPAASELITSHLTRESSNQASHHGGAVAPRDANQPC